MKVASVSLTRKLAGNDLSESKSTGYGGRILVAIDRGGVESPVTSFSVPKLRIAADPLAAATFLCRKLSAGV